MQINARTKDYAPVNPTPKPFPPEFFTQPLTGKSNVIPLASFVLPTLDCVCCFLAPVFKAKPRINDYSLPSHGLVVIKGAVAELG